MTFEQELLILIAIPIAGMVFGAILAIQEYRATRTPKQKG